MNKPVLPKGFKRVEEFEPCPECGGEERAVIGSQKQCDIVTVGSHFLTV
jgi:hypothetical protein